MIYQANDKNDIANIIMAKEGTMNKTPDNNTLLLKLKDGVRYQESPGKNSYYNPRQELYRIRFKQTDVPFDLSSFKMNKTDENSFRSNNAMLNLKGLVHKKDSLRKELDSVNRSSKENIGSYYKQNNYTKGYTKIKIKPIVVKGDIMNYIPKNERAMVAQSALDIANAVHQSAVVRQTEHKDRSVNLIKIDIEYWKKYTLAVSCILLFFIGAPLGAIIRKGGMGLPVVMAVIFFLIYHIISTVAEKSAVQGSLVPVAGAWMAIILLSPLAAFLTYKATVDSALFDAGYYKGLVVNLFKRKKNTAQ